MPLVGHGLGILGLEEPPDVAMVEVAKGGATLEVARVVARVEVARVEVARVEVVTVVVGTGAGGGEVAGMAGEAMAAVMRKGICC